MSTHQALPGWHGKLPSLGDFASRRLDSRFIEPWDDWLAAGLLALREAQPETWLPAYLASPSWRFLLLPGVLPGAAAAQAWAGVLMPSVDRVGRYFPFTLAQAIGAGPADPAQLGGLWQWLARLDELARDALYDDWTVERLEQELAALRGHGLPASPLPAPALHGMELDAHDADATTLIGRQAMQAWLDQAHGHAWWQARPDDAPARLRVTRGLPAPSSMARWFGAAATI